MALESQTHPTYSMVLVKNELIFLSDQFSIFTPWPEDMCSSPDELIRKIGKAYLVMDDNPSMGNTQVSFTLDELWMMREVAKSSAMIGPDKVGINLLRKTFEGIFQLEDESEEELDTETSNQELPDFMRDFKIGE